MDWEKAEEHLSEVRREYAKIGKVGMFAVLYAIDPLKERLDAGERTKELYDEIMDIEL